MFGLFLEIYFTPSFREHGIRIRWNQIAGYLPMISLESKEQIRKGQSHQHPIEFLFSCLVTSHPGTLLGSFNIQKKKNLRSKFFATLKKKKKRYIQANSASESSHPPSSLEPQARNKNLSLSG